MNSTADQGYTRQELAGAGIAHDARLEVVKLPEVKRGIGR
jgi:hypothetical protein